MTFIPTFLFPHFLVPPPAARERSINECRDKLVLWDGKSMKSHLKRMGGGGAVVMRNSNISKCVCAWCGRCGLY